VRGRSDLDPAATAGHARDRFEGQGMITEQERR